MRALLIAALLSGAAGRGRAAAPAAAPTGSMTLAEAYQRALALSEQVHIAAESQGMAETSYTGALTIMGPTAVITGRGTYQNAIERVQPGYATDARATLNLPLIRAAIFAARRAAARGVSGAEEQLRRAKQQLMFDVATTFIAVLQGRQQVSISQAAVKRAETQLQIATGRVKAGGALPTEVLLAQIELTRSQLQLNGAEGALRQQESSFERWVGERPSASLTLPATPSLALEAYERATRDRPDVRALHFASEQAQLTVGQLKGRLWPTLDLNVWGGYTFFQNPFYNIDPMRPGDPETGRPAYGLTGVLTVPLFQGGDEWVQIKLQRRRAAIAAYNESFQRRIVGDETRRALARVEIARRSIEIATEQLKVATQNFQIVANQYRLGVVNQLNLVTAQTAVFEAETNKALAGYELELATYQLLFAEGTISL